VAPVIAAYSFFACLADGVRTGSPYGSGGPASRAGCAAANRTDEVRTSNRWRSSGGDIGGSSDVVRGPEMGGWPQQESTGARHPRDEVPASTGLVAAAKEKQAAEHVGGNVTSSGTDHEAAAHGLRHLSR